MMESTTRPQTRGLAPWLVVGLAGLAGVLVARVAPAQAPPAARGTEEVYFPDGTGQTINTVPGSATANASGPGEFGGTYSASGSASVTPGPNPVVSSSSSDTNGYPILGGCNGYASPCVNTSGVLVYYLEVTAPAGATSATLDVYTSASANATVGGSIDTSAFASATASLSLLPNSVAGSALNLTATDVACLPACTNAGFQTNFVPMTPYTIYFNAPGQPTQIQIGMSVSGIIDVVGQGTASTSISVDPYFAIDPSTPDAAGYTLAFSSGIGNAPIPTPLPAAAWLLLSGLGGMIVLARRRVAR
jgi:hypothetical protein